MTDKSRIRHWAIKDPVTNKITKTSKVTGIGTFNALKKKFATPYENEILEILQMLRAVGNIGVRSKVIAREYNNAFHTIKTEANIGAKLSQMVAKGLVTARPDPDDKRGALYTLVTC